MNRRNLLFIQLSFIYFLTGAFLGLLLLWWPEILPDGLPRRAHGHLMSIGFIVMMIFGIALHVLPRFSGKPLHSERMADIQFWSMNTGLCLSCTGWLWFPDFFWLIATGGFFLTAGVLMFGINLALTMKSNTVRSAASERITKAG